MRVKMVMRCNMGIILRVYALVKFVNHELKLSLFKILFMIHFFFSIL